MTGQRYRAYRNLAALYHGRYESRGLSDPPTVSFVHNGSTVRVGLAPTIAGQPEQIPRTRVVARFGKGIPFRLELAPLCRPAPPQPPRGTRPVRVQEPSFDRTYIVQANDHEMARDFLGRPSGPRSRTSSAWSTPAACWSRSIPSGCSCRSTATWARATRRWPRPCARPWWSTTGSSRA